MKEAQKGKSYKSPPRKLVAFFEKSRDRWKAKCREAKIEVKRLKNRVRFLERSKEHWKSRVKELEAELAMVKAKERGKEEELEQLKKRLPKNQWSQEARKRLISFLTITSTLSDMSRCLCHWCYQQRQVFDVQVEPSRQSYCLYNFRYPPPSRFSGRFWLFRLGYYKLTRPKERADDWVWIVDHTVQLGDEKCLVILCIRLCNLPAPGDCLSHEDVEPLALFPVKQSNGEVVFQ